MSAEQAPQPSQAHKNRGPPVDTALHVIKGAIVSVLGKGAAVTASVEFSSKSKGAITVLWDGPKPTPEQQQAIEDAANACIQANKPLKQFEMSRSAAEAKYTANPVNLTYIYDNFPVPAHVSTLQIVEIPEWNVNCCPGPHLETTGGLEALRITKLNTKGAKLIFQFAVGAAAVSELEREKLTKQVLTPTHALHTPKALHIDPSKGSEQKLHQNLHTPHPVHPTEPKASLVQQTSNHLLEAALKVLTDLKIAHDDKFDAKFKQTLKEEFESQLTAVQNNAFANGFNARLPPRK